jgi:DNA-binding NarL/FixJ family response regulator
MSIDVLIVDDHAAVRAGLRAIVENDDTLRVIGTAGNGDEALERARRLRPDVVLLDIQMPRRSGLDVARELASLPGCRVLVLTTFENNDYVDAAIAAGAAGFVLKSASADDLLRAIRSVSEGDAVLAASVTRSLLERLATAAPAVDPVFPEAMAAVGTLTARERDVLGLLGRGLSNAEIGRALTVSEATARTHVSNMLGKLGVSSRVHAAIVARDAQITPSGG